MEYATKNIICGILFSLIIIVVVKNMHSYNWVYNNLLIANYEITQDFSTLTTGEKYEHKYGFFYTYMNFIKENTPEDAKILMPSDSLILAIHPKYKMKKLKDRRSTTYFLYPRKSIYRKSKFDDIKGVTHSCIIEFKGYKMENNEKIPQYRFSLKHIKSTKKI